MILIPWSANVCDKGMLRYGRPAPDYSRSDRVAVVLQLKNAPANLPFSRKVLEEEKTRGGRLPIDELLLMAQNLPENGYPGSGHNSPYIRETGEALLPGLPEQFVLQYAKKHGRIRRKEVMDLCQLTENQAAALLRQLKNTGELTRRGKGRGTFYSLPSIEHRNDLE